MVVYLHRKYPAITGRGNTLGLGSVSCSASVEHPKWNGIRKHWTEGTGGRRSKVLAQWLLIPNCNHQWERMLATVYLRKQLEDINSYPV